MEIKGYKAFNKDHTNRYGMPFLEGKEYHVDGSISFGNDGNGFHMCTHLSDVFRYFDPENIDVAEVIGSGEYVLEDVEDWSEPYLDMYAVSDIKIIKFLSREKIIEIIKNSSESDIVKFLATCPVTEEEGLQIIRNNRNSIKIMKAFIYYALKNADAYILSDEERKLILKRVLNDGQDSNQRGKGK